MEGLSAHELGAILLSSSFLAALIVGGIVGWLSGLLPGAGAGMLVVSSMALGAAWITWQAGDEPDRGWIRIEGSVSMDPQKKNASSPSDQALTNHDLVVRYKDPQGHERELSGAYSGFRLTPGQTVKLEYHPGQAEPPRVADPNRHRALLTVFLLFGTVPLAMSAVMFTAAWEGRHGYQPSPRSPGVVKLCVWGRVFANIALVSGVAVSLWEPEVAALGRGFPLVGAAALGHAVFGAVAGLRPSMVCTLLVIAVGFIGFGLFAQQVA